jgi:hypothetical protein
VVAICGIAIVIGGPLILAWRTMDSRVLRLETIYEERQKAETIQRTTEIEQRSLLTQQIAALANRLTDLQIDVAKLVGAASVRNTTNGKH